MNEIEARKIQIAAKAAFIGALEQLGALEIGIGSAVMPREIWAQAMIAALVDSGILAPETDDLNKAQAIFDSELGNASQLGALLLKEGTIKRRGASAEAESFLAKLAARGA